MVKKSIVIILLFLPFVVRCQFYRPFPEGEAVWTVVSEHINYCPLDANAFTEYYSYIIQVGDTAINGNVYHKIYKEPFYDPPNGYPYLFADTGYIGALRQNIALKQVYVFFKDDSLERLLYDFSVDTINAPFPNTILKPDNSARLLLVEPVWLVNSNGSTLHFIYSDTVTDVCGNQVGYTMSEGIGGGGLVSKTGFFVASGTNDYLISDITTCLSENGMLVSQPYNDTIIDTAEYRYCVTTLTASITQLPGGYHIKVFPNPATDQITVAYNDLPAGYLYFYDAFDILGNRVIHQQLYPAVTLVPCNDLVPGFYLWQVTNEQGAKLTGGKIVKE